MTERFKVLDDFLFQPFATDKADGEAEGAEYPVKVHTHPDAQQLTVEAQNHQITEADPKYPHREDADGHSEGRIPCRTKNVG